MKLPIDHLTVLFDPFYIYLSSSVSDNINIHGNINCFHYIKDNHRIWDTAGKTARLISPISFSTYVKEIFAESYENATHVTIRSHLDSSRSDIPLIIVINKEHNEMIHLLPKREAERNIFGKMINGGRTCRFCGKDSKELPYLIRINITDKNERRHKYYVNDEYLCKDCLKLRDIQPHDVYRVRNRIRLLTSVTDSMDPDIIISAKFKKIEDDLYLLENGVFICDMSSFNVTRIKVHEKLMATSVVIVVKIQAIFYLETWLSATEMIK